MSPKKFLTQLPYLLLSLLILFSFFIKQAFSVVSIWTPRDLITFSNYINDDYGVFKSTVMLENDLDMGDMPSFNPIGINSERMFLGTFDGNGHVIHNINITSNNDYVGLFGVSHGVTLKNLVFVKSNFILGTGGDKRSPSFLGGFVGSCVSKYESCILQNLVNMAITIGYDNKFVGGIAGFIGSSSSSYYNSRVVNCINIAPVCVAGELPAVYYGGIVGVTASTGSKVFIQNCGNYGNIEQHSANFMLYAGGIVGNIADNTIVQNCINTGSIETNSRYSIGNIVGKLENIHGLKSEIMNCYWEEGAYENRIVGKNEYDYGSIVKETSAFRNDLTLVNPVVLNYIKKNEVIGALNSFADNSFERWLLLDYNCTASEKGYTSFKMIVYENFNSLFSPKLNDHIFRGWYLDSKFKLMFDPETDDISMIEKLCAKWAYPINVTFVIGAEKTTEIMVNDNIEYPDVEIEYGYKAEWCTQDKKKCNPVESDVDIELFLIQSPKDFTLKFNSNGGTRIGYKEVKFNEIIGKLPVPEKEDCVFLGWYIDPDFKYPFYLKRMPDHDVKLYAKWRYASSLGEAFAWYASLICLVMGVVAAWVIFSRRDIIGLKI